MSIRQTDAEIRKRLRSYSRNDEDYWSFREKGPREHLHAYFQYPAMMVPQMQGVLIDTITGFVPRVRRVYDPFVGSGTVMTEAMLRGLDFVGQDVNPLAVLLSKTKSGPFNQESLSKRLHVLLRAIKADRGTRTEADFPRLRKWFKPQVVAQLSKIRRAIRKEPTLWCRRFFWVALAETVRLVSNSRTSTYKLHIRPKEEIRSRRTSPVGVFERVAKTNLKSLSAYKDLLQEKKLLKRGRYTRNVEIALGDSSQAGRCEGHRLFDLLVTSPPYGDNPTTIPYGQHSFLPLQWIDLEDIDENADAACLTTAYEIDRHSLGGSRRVTSEQIKELSALSPSFKRTIHKLRHEPADRISRVSAFVYGLNSCLDPILDTLKHNAYMIWTIGDRRVGGCRVPTAEILVELLVHKNATPIARLKRRIPSKRLAVKNSITATMRAETILVMRKGNKP